MPENSKQAVPLESALGHHILTNGIVKLNSYIHHKSSLIWPHPFETEEGLVHTDVGQFISALSACSQFWLC